ncbi:hypothetical protein WUBG_16150 [Wuchereria bancrofti]|uniref:Uncharacterized protein n=1 Tax=Wuchereria bancrofti TaxID=6293 RepID=J9DTG1_WUCBA|nr:hypothetical protein WUBG_16150 [Wuchereria bancrofti]
MKHCGTDIVKHLPTSKYEWVEIDSNLCKAFANSKFVLSTLADMRKELAELGLKRLLGFCELLLVCNLKSTKPRDFVCACSFLLSLVKITEERLSVPRPRVVLKYTGALSDCQYTMKHCGTDIVKHLPTSKYEWVEIDSNLCKAFANSKFVLSTLADMRKELAELGLKRLLGFYYGRAFKRSSAPRSAEEKPKDKELPQELERLPRAKESNLRTTIEAIDRIIELLGFQGEDVNSTLIIYLIMYQFVIVTLYNF